MAELYKLSAIKAAIPPAPESTETDEQIIDRITERFAVLRDMTLAVKAGHINSLIVLGAPGVGKSETVTSCLAKYETMAKVADNMKLKKFEVVKGSMTALGLYVKLYQYSEEKSVVVLDDVDSIFSDEQSLNILKGALDSNKKRVIHWNSDSRLLRTEGIPNSFEFNGSCIFITNINFDNIRSKKLKDHIAAFKSRSHIIDLTIQTNREKLLWIKKIVGEGMLDSYNFAEEGVVELLDFVYENQDSLRELSLRMLKNIADLKATMPSTWKRVAALTCMKE